MVTPAGKLYGQRRRQIGRRTTRVVQGNRGGSELPPARMAGGLKSLPSGGGGGACGTVNVATAGPALLPLLVCRTPVGSELM